MLKIFWYVIIAVIIAGLLGWMLDNNGVVTIIWLNHEIKTDLLTAFCIGLIFVLIILIIINFLTKLFALKNLKKDPKI